MSEESEESEAVWVPLKAARVAERLDNWVDRICRDGGADGGWV